MNMAQSRNGNFNVIPDDPVNRQKGYLRAKRLFDIVVCVLFLPIALCIMGAIALLIKFDSPGPVIFVQERVGKGGRRYKMYKFRSMVYGHNDRADRAFMKSYISGESVSNTEGTAPSFKPNHRASITRVGNILRKTSLDEAPQLFNVLKGDMSLVGPRPNVPWEVDEYRWWHTERMEVLPGMTGLAQVRGRSGLHFDTLVRYDIEYVRKRSFKLDLKILWWTVLTVISGQGAG